MMRRALRSFKNGLSKVFKYEVQFSVKGDILKKTPLKKEKDEEKKK